MVDLGESPGIHIYRGGFPLLHREHTGGFPLLGREHTADFLQVTVAETNPYGSLGPWTS